MADHRRLIQERPIHARIPGGSGRGAGSAARTVTVNLAESPLGWLFARGHLTQRQVDAGEQLRRDFEHAQLAPGVTMRWDGAPAARGISAPADPRDARIDAQRRFDAAVDSAGPGLGDILWRIVCAGEGMRDAETALGWPRPRRQGRALPGARPGRRLLPHPLTQKGPRDPKATRPD